MVLLENGTEGKPKASAGNHLGGCSTVNALTTDNVRLGASRSEGLVSPTAGSPDFRPSGADDLDGEFDPGSGRTLAACLTHASRTRSNQWQHWGRPSGERVSNT